MLIDGSEIGIRKGIKVARIHIPEPRCAKCMKYIEDNLYKTIIDRTGTCVKLVCDTCVEKGD